MGVPIRLPTGNLDLKADREHAAVDGKKIIFYVRNMGYTYYTVTNAVLTGLSKSGTPTFTREQDGWYVLAGGVRRFQFEVPVESCTGTDHIRVEIGTSLTDDRGTPIQNSPERSFTGWKLCPPCQRSATT